MFYRSAWCLTLTLKFALSLPRITTNLVPYAHKTDTHSHNRCNQRNKVSASVAIQSLITLHDTILVLDAMVIIHKAEKCIEDIAEDDGRNRNTTPISRQSMDAELLCDDGRKDAKEEAIGETCHGRYNGEVLRIGDCDRA